MRATSTSSVPTDSTDYAAVRDKYRNVPSGFADRTTETVPAADEAWDEPVRAAAPETWTPEPAASPHPPLHPDEARPLTRTSTTTRRPR